jgi:hypothetical protein
MVKIQAKTHEGLHGKWSLQLSSQNENLGGVTMIPIIPKYKNFIKIY